MSRPYCLQPDACSAAKPTTHCRRCSILRVAKDPELEALRLANLRSRYDDPAYLAEHQQRLRDTTARLKRCPEHQQRLREQGQRLQRDFLSRPDVVAQNRSPETRARAGRTCSERLMAWCPPERREEYRWLIQTKGLKAADARRAILSNVPGTVEHAKLAVANAQLAGQLKHARDVESRY